MPNTVVTHYIMYPHKARCLHEKAHMAYNVPIYICIDKQKIFHPNLCFIPSEGYLSLLTLRGTVAVWNECSHHYSVAAKYKFFVGILDTINFCVLCLTHSLPDLLLRAVDRSEREVLAMARENVT